MTDTVATPADAGATPAVAEKPVDQAQTPATTTPENALAKPEDAEKPAVADEQPRDLEGKFLPKSPRVAKLQSTINDLTRQKHDAARELDRLKSEAAAIAKQLESKPQIAPDDFEGQQTESIKRALKQQRLEDISERARQVETDSQSKTGEIIAAQVEEMREHIPDIDGIFRSPAEGGPRISAVMAEAIARSENGALVAYHLMKNPRESARLYHADPVTALIEIGKIAATVKPAPVKRVSQAPQPVQTVSGSPGNPAPDLGSLSFKDYERLRNEQELARR